MKIAIHHDIPFALAHGGTQVLIEKLMEHLPQCGVTVEPLRWWDARQEMDIIHSFGRPSDLLAELMVGKNIALVMSEILEAAAGRNRWELLGFRLLKLLISRCAGASVGRLGWHVHRHVAAAIYASPVELELARNLYGLPSNRGYLLPYGLTSQELDALAREDREAGHLVCVATIHPRKNVLLLARAAREAETSVIFLGKPYSENDIYFKEFMGLVDGRNVIYRGYVSAEEKQTLLRQARGFVLLSNYESGCMAVYEAAAAGLPMLLADRPWARASYAVYGDVHFVSLHSLPATAAKLKEFYRQAHRRVGRQIFPVPTWDEVAQRYVEIYRQVLS